MAEREERSGNADGVGTGGGVAGPVEQVVVVEVHEDGHRLPQEDARPNNHVANLPLGKREGRDHAQRNLKRKRQKCCIAGICCIF